MPVLRFWFIAPFALFAQSKTGRVQQGVPQIAGQIGAKRRCGSIQFCVLVKLRVRRSDPQMLRKLVAQNRPGADADNMGALKSVVVGTTVFEAKKNEQPQPLFTSNMVPHNMAIQV